MPQVSFEILIHGEVQAAASRATRGLLGGTYGVGLRTRNPFYKRPNEILDGEGSDVGVEGNCGRLYAAGFGLAPPTPRTCFRSMLLGHFEDICANVASSGGRLFHWPCGVSWAMHWAKPRLPIVDFPHGTANRSGYICCDHRMGFGCSNSG